MSVIALYGPDGYLIATFHGPHAQENAENYFREWCSEFCYLRDFDRIDLVPDWSSRVA